MTLILFFVLAAHADVVRIPISDEWRACKTTKDCIQVSARCDDCCEEEGLNRNLLDKYKAEREKTCPKGNGAVCDCPVPKYHLACVAKLCEIVFEKKK